MLYSVIQVSVIYLVRIYNVLYSKSLTTCVDFFWVYLRFSSLIYSTESLQSIFEDEYLQLTVLYSSPLLRMLSFFGAEELFSIE